MKLLGGLAPAAFLRTHWQKKPLLIRQAIPKFRGILTRDQLLRLAARDDATSRLVVEHPRARSSAARWERHDGPFGALDAKMLPAAHWTLLVHGVESLVPGGWELLRRFSFIPSARIDDLMISYAADRGGVGAHDDRYDVFLLQGPGRRRWRIASRYDRAHDPRAAIKVLAHFDAEEEWLLEPGDMLYLPPDVAHWGVAEGPCFTYSIGFLAPSRRALVQSFLGYLQHELGAAVPDELLEDPELAPARAPLEIGDDYLARVTRALGAVRFGRAQIEDFLGRFLTLPKPHVRFAARRARGRKIALALPSRGLVRGRRIYVNGEAFPRSSTLERLVEERSASWSSLRGKDREIVREWIEAGWARFSSS